MICIDDNNAVINKTMEDSKALFCSSKFPMGMQKNFFEIYRQFGHASSRRFASPAQNETQTVVLSDAFQSVKSTLICSKIFQNLILS